MALKELNLKPNLNLKMLKIEKEVNYNIVIDGCTYIVDITYIASPFGKKQIPAIHGIQHKGVELYPIIKGEIVEDIRSYLFKKKNNITT